METVGVKESLELVKAVELLAITGIEIAKDGVGPEDVAPALNLLSQVNVIIEGVKGADKIGEELKDIDQAEAAQVGFALFAVYKKIRESAKKAE